MISSVSSNQMMPPPPPQGGGQKSSSTELTSEQQDTIASVLSEFDASALTQDDATSIVESFKEAGIEPSKAMASAMEDAGFDAKEIGDMAGVGRRQGQGQMMPPPPQQGEEDSISQLLDTLLSSDEDESSTTSNNSFDQIMEYTSKILNLNDSSKNEVMDILDKYSSDESDYSQEDKSKLVVNSLNSILEDGSNYNRLSLYA